MLMKRPATWAFFVFVLSGAAGLVYQSVWTQYLGLILGHAAYAQTLVLAIYMGGMALGAWLASRWTVRWSRLLLAYAIAEVLIGICGLLFHPVFVSLGAFSQQVVLPALANPFFAHAWQWLSAAALMTPQSLLLGATFPLMSAALIRLAPETKGSVLGGLYFTNSLGAAVGALGSTFLLIPAVGLPGTILTAGLLSLLVGFIAWWMDNAVRLQTIESANISRNDKSEPSVTGAFPVGKLLLGAAGLSGAASFIYEIVWVRMLNQALGSSIHSFELMLAAFILGLAFGGLWVNRRADGIVHVLRYVGIVQLIMGVTALLSAPAFAASFHWTAWLRQALTKSDGGFVLYELGSAGIAMLVMFPTAFFAGMTLPLFTLAWMRSGGGEHAIGRIYAVNTLGAIFGVMVATHLLVPYIGLHLSLISAAMLDILVGLILLGAIQKKVTTRTNLVRLSAPLAGLVIGCAVWAALVFGHADPLQQASGVFRTGVLLTNGEVVYQRDGKTATVSVINAGKEGENKTVSIITNGKPDASLSPMSLEPTDDEYTMVMLGSMPVLMHPNPRKVALIGWGSGLSTHTVLGSNKPKQVDTVEIEQAMVDGARHFGSSVERAYRDPRSRLHVEDARTFFSTGNRRYDVIISEPSNPWVNGVAGLFTKEFYSFLKQHLNEDGLLVQWLHLYEIDDRLVGAMLSAMRVEFPSMDIYFANESDLVIVASVKPSTKKESHVYWPTEPALLAEMKRVGFTSSESLKLRRLGDERFVAAYTAAIGAGQPHSDYFPMVALGAPKTMFKSEYARKLTELNSVYLPLQEMLLCESGPDTNVAIARHGDSPRLLLHEQAKWIIESLVGRENSTANEPWREWEGQGIADALLRKSQSVATDTESLKSWSNSLHVVAARTIPHLSSKELEEAWSGRNWLPESAARTNSVQMAVQMYEAMAKRDARLMSSRAQDLLKSGVRYDDSLLIHAMQIAMLGEISQGHPENAIAIAKKWVGGVSDNPQASGNFTTLFLVAWAKQNRGNTCQAPIETH